MTSVTRIGRSYDEQLSHEELAVEITLDLVQHRAEEDYAGIGLERIAELGTSCQVEVLHEIVGQLAKFVRLLDLGGHSDAGPVDLDALVADVWAKIRAGKR